MRRNVEKSTTLPRPADQARALVAARRASRPAVPEVGSERDVG